MVVVPVVVVAVVVVAAAEVVAAEVVAVVAAVVVALIALISLILPPHLPVYLLQATHKMFSSLSPIIFSDI